MVVLLRQTNKFLLGNFLVGKTERQEFAFRYLKAEAMLNEGESTTRTLHANL